MNQLKLVGLKLRDAVKKIIANEPDAIFIVDGIGLFGGFHKVNGIDEDNFIQVADIMFTNTMHPNIMSEEFVALRVQSYSFLFSGDDMHEEYEQFATKLRNLSQNSKIYFIQVDCYVSQIWQLVMQAYMEQARITKHIKRLCYSNFVVNDFNDIAISGSYEAYYNLICCHNPMNLDRYLIDTEAVKCYLDVNTDNTILKEYIRKKGPHFKNKYQVFGQFIKDFPNWGLEEIIFLKIWNDIGVDDREQDEKKIRWRI